VGNTATSFSGETPTDRRESRAMIQIAGPACDVAASIAGERL
jgi:hypothetical protein